MARPVKHDEATREVLLDAAEELLAAGGPDAVSVRAVADRAGVSTRAVYSVFGSMSGLMGGLGARGFQMVADLVNALPVTDDPLADLADTGVLAFRRFALERPHLYQITYKNVSAAIYRQAEATPALMASYESLATRFERAMEMGAMPRRDVRELVFAFHALSSGMAMNELSREPPPVGANFWMFLRDVDLEPVWRTAFTAFVQGLTR